MIVWVWPTIYGSLETSRPSCQLQATTLEFLLLWFLAYSSKSLSLSLPSSFKITTLLHMEPLPFLPKEFETGLKFNQKDTLSCTSYLEASDTEWRGRWRGVKTSLRKVRGSLHGCGTVQPRRELEQSILIISLHAKHNKRQFLLSLPKNCYINILSVVPTTPTNNQYLQHSNMLQGNIIPLLEAWRAQNVSSIWALPMIKTATQLHDRQNCPTKSSSWDINYNEK